MSDICEHTKRMEVTEMNKEQFTIDLEQLCIRHKVAIVWSPEFCTIQIHDDDLSVPLGTGCKLEFVQATK